MKKIKYVQVSMKDAEEVSKKVVEEYEVGLENEQHLIIRDEHLTRLDKHKVKKGRYQLNTLIEGVSVADYSRDKVMRDIMGGMFIIRIYSYKSLSEIQGIINKEYNKWLKDKVGAYITCNEVEIKL